jgi:hypothetical protein
MDWDKWAVDFHREAKADTDQARVLILEGICELAKTLGRIASALEKSNQ